jgi:BMFP domain-containing protein YqiC
MASAQTAVKVNLRRALNMLASRRGRPYFIYNDHWRLRPKRRELKSMSTGTNRILDDFARLMTDAAGAAQGVRREVETAFQAQAERFLNNMDIVKREEFEAVREMAARARDENDALKARIEALEAKLASQG